MRNGIIKILLKACDNDNRSLVCGRIWDDVVIVVRHFYEIIKRLKESHNEDTGMRVISERRIRL